VDVKSFGRIYGDMVNYIIAHQDRLTDFNDGSVLASQIEATAREIAMLYVACRVGFSTHLRSLPYSVFGFERMEGTRASTRVVLSRSRPLSHETPIPAGTIVSAGNLSFATSVAASVSSGETDSPPIPAVAAAVGDGFNVGAGTISTVVSTLPADIIMVSNPVPATGGENAEDWAAYMDRFADFVLGLQRTNASGFLSGLIGGGIIRSMSAVEHFPPAGGIWNMTLYLEDGSGSMTPEALGEAKRTIDGNFLEGIGGYRAPGVNIRYLTPDIVPVTVHATVTANEDIVRDMDISVVAGEVTEAVRKFVNALKIGQSVLVSDLIVVLRGLPILANAHVLLPASDIAIGRSGIARYEDCVVTVEI